MRRRLLSAGVLAVLTVFLVSGMALGSQRSISLHASNVWGEGTLHCYHNYTELNRTQWRNTTMQYKVTGNTRPKNNVQIKLYNQGSQIWGISRGDIVGGRSYNQDVSRTTYKYATKSWWKIIADARIGWDPSATGNIGIF